jgi:hypothetical protein
VKKQSRGDEAVVNKSKRNEQDRKRGIQEEKKKLLSM